MKDAMQLLVVTPCILCVTARRSILFFGLLTIFSLVGCGSDSNALSTASDTMLGAVKASLDGDGHTLLAQGKGKEGQTVTLRIPDTGAVIGTTTVSDDGRWSLRVAGLRDVHCLADVEIGDVRGEISVKGACNNDGTRPLSISGAEWEEDDGKLKVKGKSAPEAGVRVSNAGAITECTVCHEAGSLGLTLDGPHGMHPVNDARWSKDHEDVAEGNKDQCRACHGLNGEGSMLSRVAADRILQTDDNGSVFLPRGTPVRCDTCHENEL